MRKCPNCDSTKLEFSVGVKTPTDVVDGRLRANECSPIAVLGCTECSETVEIFYEHEIVEMLNRGLFR